MVACADCMRETFSPFSFGASTTYGMRAKVDSMRWKTIHLTTVIGPMQRCVGGPTAAGTGRQAPSPAHGIYRHDSTSTTNEFPILRIIFLAARPTTCSSLC